MNTLYKSLNEAKGHPYGFAVLSFLFKVGPEKQLLPLPKQKQFVPNHFFFWIGLLWSCLIWWSNVSSQESSGSWAETSLASLHEICFNMRCWSWTQYLKTSRKFMGANPNIREVLWTIVWQCYINDLHHHKFNPSCCLQHRSFFRLKNVSQTYLHWIPSCLKRFLGIRRIKRSLEMGKDQKQVSGGFL